VRLPKPLAIAVLILAAQLSMLAADMAVLRNGFSIRHVRREQIGDITRLYTAEGYVDIPTAEIASFEAEELPPPQPVETSVQQPQPTAITAPAQPVTLSAKVDIDAVIREASQRRQLDPDFVNSVIKAESNFHPRAVSPKGAQGLMQLMPQTAAKLGVIDPFDPRANVEAGTAYLSDLLDLYHNDPIKALAAYNAGTLRVQQYHGVPPYSETRSYIARIVRDFNAKKKAQMAQTQTAQNAQKPVSGRKSTRVASTVTKNATKKNSNKMKAQQASVSPPQASGGTQ
jgi:soluble lytic murein transglycosylase-like protein